MKIEKVILQNIGVYVNKNEFDLQSDQPIILIGGMNGRGKTTFLDSILFALYGRRFHESVQTVQNLAGYLRKISNVSGEHSECSIELHFTVQEQECVTYCVRRSWDSARSNPRMLTQVSKNGTPDPILSENWDMFVEEILPRAIASFFFFDGEKIAELAASENDEHIRSAIMSLLGIDILNQLLADLHTVSASSQKMIDQNTYKEELEELNQRLSDQEHAIAETESEIRNEQERLSQLEKELVSLENEYTTAGGHYAEHRKQFEEERMEILLELEADQNQMLDLAAGSLPLQMTESLLADVLKNSTAENEQRELRAFVKQFPLLYGDYSGGKGFNRDLSLFFEAVKERVAADEDVYDLDDEARERLSGLEEILDQDTCRSRILIQEKQRLNRRLEEIENYLAIQVKDEKVSALFEQIKEKSAKKGEALQHLAAMEQNLELLQSGAESLKKQQKQILRELVEKLDAADEHLRMVSYAQKQIGLLQAYKERLQELKANTLAEQMTECFHRIIAKDGLIQRITIDAKNLEFSYFNRNGQQIDKQILSSGEKQLLVIAMLWALGICAKSQFPLIIDTPLARLDSVHRASLIENYFPKASEQVIILSTDQEITQQDYHSLKKHLGKEYTLVYDEATMSSAICEGYFGRSEA